MFSTPVFYSHNTLILLVTRELIYCNSWAYGRDTKVFLSIETLNESFFKITFDKHWYNVEIYSRLRLALLPLCHNYKCPYISLTTQIYTLLHGIQMMWKWRLSQLTKGPWSRKGSEFILPILWKTLVREDSHFRAVRKWVLVLNVL